MNHIEQDWHAFKATLPSTNHMSWDEAITQHTEREWHQSRERASMERDVRGAKQKRNGGYHVRTTRRTR